MVQVSMKLISYTSEQIWRSVVIVLSALIFLQLLFSRHVFDVTIYTYRILQSYYVQEGQWYDRFSSGNMTNGNSSKVTFDGLMPPVHMAAKSRNGTRSSLQRINLINKSEIQAADVPMSNVRKIHFNRNQSPSVKQCSPELRSTFVFNESAALVTAPGGEWNPTSCQPVASVALIIPFRERYAHLRRFLPYMHAFLQKQQLHYRIYVIEQYDNSSFNRAKLMNIGFREVSKSWKYDCYVFHDVDLLPLDERIGYNCSENGPIHLAAAMDKFGFAMPYNGFFGGACAFTEYQLERINGFSNKFAGWGGEDDDIDKRIMYSGQEAQRYPIHIARYHMIRHGPDKGNEANPQRHRLLEQTKNNWRSDGLNSLKYEVVNITENSLYTKISVDV